MSLREFIDSALRNEPINNNCTQRKKSRNFGKLLIALITFSSVVGGEKEGLLQILRINLFVGASIASKYNKFI